MDDNGTIELDNVPIRDTWEALESIVDQGIARSIGVSNFQAQSIMDLNTYARIPISALQIEHHPYLVQPDLVALAKEMNIAVTAYSSLGPQSYVELNNGRASANELLMETDTVKKAAEKHGKSPAQVLLRWATQREVAVIPKSNNPDRLAQNLDVLNFDLTEAEIYEISGLDKGIRFNDPGYYLTTRPLRIF